MNLNLLKKDNFLLIIGSILMLLDFDDIGIVFIIIVLIKSFIKSENKVKSLLEMLAFTTLFVLFLFVLNKIQFMSM